MPLIYPPLNPDPDPAPLSPTIPLNPPMVGEASPFDHVDGQNRDLILESIRAWIRGVLLVWTTAWQRYLVYWLALVEAWLEGFITAADAYITEYAVAGYSWRTTVTPIAISGPTTVVITGFDAVHRPLVVGDLVSDQTDSKRYGIITSLVDATHAVVNPLGILSGLPGHSWWVTATPIGATGTTNVVLAAEVDRLPQVNDLVSDESSALRYGIVTVVIDATHVTVSPLGTLRGLAGFGWWTTATPIAHGGSTAVVLATGPDRVPEVNDLVVDQTTSSAYGEVTAVTDATHVTVMYVGTLQGPSGIAGSGMFAVTTPVVAPGAAYQAQMAGQPQMVGAYKLITSAPSWVRIYASQAQMITDQGRPIGAPLDIAADHGCYLDFVGVTSELTKTLTPGVQISDIGSGLWLSVVNTDPANPETVTLTLDYRIFLS
jgi:hypothetical protein